MKRRKKSSERRLLEHLGTDQPCEMLPRQLLRTHAPIASTSRLLHTSSSLLSPLPTTISSALQQSNCSSSSDASITINGWIKSCRRQKNISFAVINDGSSVGGVQAVLGKGMDERCVSPVSCTRLS